MKSKINKVFKAVLVLGTFYFMNFSLLSAQQHEIDSLAKVLKKEKEDTAKAKTLNNLAMQYEGIGSFSASDSVSRIALDLAGKLGYRKAIAIAFRHIGIVCFDKADYPNAVKYQKLALEIYTELENKKGMGDIYGNLGNIYFVQSNFPDAIKYQKMAAQIDGDIHNMQGLGVDYGNIGNIYEQQGNYPEALHYQLMSLKVEQDLGDKESIGNAYANIGSIYADENDLGNALRNLLKALELEKELGDKKSVAANYEDIGLLYITKKSYDSAFVYLEQSLKLSQEIGYTQGVADAYGNMGSIYFKQHKYDEALENEALALKIYRQIGDKMNMSRSYETLGVIDLDEHKNTDSKKYIDSAVALAKAAGVKAVLSEAYENLATLNANMGNDKDAYENYKLFVLYRDSLKNDENTKKLVAEQMQFDFDKKQTEEKAEQGKKDAIADADKHKQQIITRSVSAGLLLVAVFAVLLYSRFRVTQQQKKIIEEQKTIVEEKNKDILDSITYAKRLQDAILPPVSIIEKYLPESFVFYKPKDIVAGDFYWLERTESSIFIAAADCTGHGVPGAMVSVVCSNALNRTVKEFKITEPGKILDKTRELVLETFEKSESNVQDGMDISLASITQLEGKEVRLQWAGAYNSLWYIPSPIGEGQGEVVELQADKQPIGKADNPKLFTTHTVTINPPLEGREAGVIYLFTDGYADQFGGPKGKKFKYKQLQEKLSVISSKPMVEQKKILEQTLEEWQGELEQVDDILIIGIRV